MQGSKLQYPRAILSYFGGSKVSRHERHVKTDHPLPLTRSTTKQHLTVPQRLSCTFYTVVTGFNNPGSIAASDANERICCWNYYFFYVKLSDLIWLYYLSISPIDFLLYTYVNTTVYNYLHRWWFYAYCAHISTYTVHTHTHTHTHIAACITHHEGERILDMHLYYVLRTCLNMLWSHTLLLWSIIFPE